MDRRFQFPKNWTLQNFLKNDEQIILEFIEFLYLKEKNTSFHIFNLNY